MVVRTNDALKLPLEGKEHNKYLRVVYKVHMLCSMSHKFGCSKCSDKPRCIESFERLLPDTTMDISPAAALEGIKRFIKLLEEPRGDNV